MSKAVIPNLPPISSIKDPDVRVALDQMWNAWRVRNGDVGDGTHKFLTAADIQDALNSVTINNPSGAGSGTTSGGKPGTAPPNTAWVGTLLGKIDDYIMSSWLWQKLGERIQNIEIPEWFIDRFDRSYGTAIKTEQKIRQEANLQLASQIVTVSAVLNDNIAVVQKTTEAYVSSTEAVARDLTLLQSEFGSARSQISQSLTTLSTANEAMAQKVDLTVAQFNGNMAGVESKVTAIANNFSSYISSTETYMAATNTTIGLVQKDTKAAADTAGAAASDVTKLQVAVGYNKDTGKADAMLKAESALETAGTIEGTLKGAWTVKFEVDSAQNPYVTGVGLSIERGPNPASIPTSSFYVRADKFAIGNPQYPGVTPIIPFKVLSTPLTLPDGQVVAPGVYMNEATVYKLTGTFIDAGTLNAAEIYTGSTWLDRVSGWPIPSQATSFFSLPGEGHYAVTPRWSGASRFYGPYYHHPGHGVPLNQKIRSSTYGSYVTFIVNATASADHYFSIWYRINGNDYYVAPVYQYYWNIDVTYDTYWGTSGSGTIQTTSVGSAAVAPNLVGTAQVISDGETSYEVYVTGQTAASVYYSQQVGGGNIASTVPWNFIGKVVEYQNDFGTAGVAGSVTVWVPNEPWYIDFGAAVIAEDGSWTSYAGKNAYLRDMNMTISAVNV